MDNSKPLVSIVMITLNEARFVVEAVESVLRQDYPNLEIIVQDGGSTDGTLDILKRYPLDWISERDRGQGDAANRGIRRARGEIISYFNGDDRYAVGAVRNAVKAFCDNPEAGWIYGDANLIDESGRVFRRWKSRTFDLDELFWQTYIPTQSVFFRSEVLRSVGGFDDRLSLCMDYDLWLRLGARFQPTYIPLTLSEHRMHSTSETALNPIRQADVCLEVVNRFFEDPYNASQVRLGKRRAYAGTYLRLASGYAMAGRVSEGYHCYAHALRLYPGVLWHSIGIKTLFRIVMGKQGSELVTHARKKLGLWWWEHLTQPPVLSE